MSLRLDADVVAWLKKPGKGYQTRANHILRERMLHELRKLRAYRAGFIRATEFRRATRRDIRLVFA